MEDISPLFAMDDVVNIEITAFLEKSPEPPMPFGMFLPCI